MIEHGSRWFIPTGLIISLFGCATASSGPTIPGPDELPTISIGDPIFVAFEDGHGYACSTWAGTKLWLSSADFADALASTLRNARANVVAAETRAKYVLSFGGAGASVSYEIRDRLGGEVVWRTSKPWPQQVAGCALCCNDHAKSHFAWLAEDLATWDGTPEVAE